MSGPYRPETVPVGLGDRERLESVRFAASIAPAGDPCLTCQLPQQPLLNQRLGPLLQLQLPDPRGSRQQLEGLGGGGAQLRPDQGAPQGPGILDLLRLHRPPRQLRLPGIGRKDDQLTLILADVPDVLGRLGKPLEGVLREDSLKPDEELLVHPLPPGPLGPLASAYR